MKDLEYLLQTDLMLQYKEGRIENVHPVSFAQAKLLFNLYQQIERKAVEEQKQIILHWLEKSFGQKRSIYDLYRAFRDAIHAARDFREAIIREFIPDTRWYMFSSDGVLITNDPIEILTTIFSPPGNANYRKRRSFEALVLWILGIRYLQMKEINNQSLGDEFLREITLWLEKDYFSSDENDLKSIKLKVLYNPDNDYCYEGLAQNDKNNFPCKEYITSFRTIQTVEKIPVMYIVREKKFEDAFEKTLRSSRGELPIAIDQKAMSFVFMNEPDLQKGRELLFEKIISNGAVIYDWKINGAGGKKVNAFSADDYCVNEKFKVFLRGERLEVQIMDFGKYFDGRLSAKKVNHRFYRLDRLGGIFPLIFPVEFYNVDWKNPEMQEELRALQKARIISNFKGHSNL